METYQPQVDLEASTSGTREDEGSEEVHQDEPHRPPSPPPQENDNANNNEGGQEEEDNEEDVPLQPKQNRSRVRARVTRDHPIEQIFDDIQTGRIMKEICPRGNNKVVIYISLYHVKCLLFMLELY